MFSSHGGHLINAMYHHEEDNMLIAHTELLLQIIDG